MLSTEALVGIVAAVITLFIVLWQLFGRLLHKSQSHSSSVQAEGAAPPISSAGKCHDGDDECIRQDFIQALTDLAFKVFDPHVAMDYYEQVTSTFGHEGMVILHPNRSKSSWYLQPKRLSVFDSMGHPSAEAGSLPGQAPRRIITRQNAFHGAYHADKVFDSRWWLDPTMDSAGSSGPYLERWMRMVRIKRRSLDIVRYDVTIPADSERDLYDRFRVAFQKTFSQFDILMPGDSESEASTPWPGFSD